MRFEMRSKNEVEVDGTLIAADIDASRNKHVIICRIRMQFFVYNKKFFSVVVIRGWRVCLNPLRPRLARAIDWHTIIVSVG